MVDPGEVAGWRERIERELWDSVVPFWLRHSLDPKHGGYFNNLDSDGSCFDERKHVWLQARQVWMLARLHRDNPERGELLEAATLGAEFLRRHARREDGRVWFCLDRQGAPAGLQRKIFAECFYAMAMAEYGRVVPGDGVQWRVEALSTLDTILELVAEPARLGRPELIGAPELSQLAVPMILLNVVGEIRGELGMPGFNDRADYDSLESRCVAQILRHFQPDTSLLHEHVAPDGSLRRDVPEGRLINPGHAIEAGWFLLEHSRRGGPSDLERQALAVIEGALRFGRDPQHGGLFYFLDCEGRSPVQLEWSQKLWWPHCEAMIATALAWRMTGMDEWWQRFVEVADYTFAHFPDPEHGEWFGYLDREGRVSQRFKGGPYKGCFHVPRALWKCAEILGADQSTQGSGAGSR